MEAIFLKIAGDIFYAAIMFGLGFLARAFRNDRAEQRAIEKGLCAILRNDIIMIHNDVIKNQQIAYTQSQNLNTMYEAYKALGGNGVIDVMMKEIKDMPVATVERNA